MVKIDCSFEYAGEEKHMYNCNDAIGGVMYLQPTAFQFSFTAYVQGSAGSEIQPLL